MTQALILAVDDDALNLEIIEEFLDESDFDLITASDGKKALQQLEKYPNVDAILLDRMMPGMSGIEFMEVMQTMPQYKHIPVIMQSAAAANVQVAEGMKYGVYYYITKPYEQELMISVVTAAINSTHYRHISNDEAEHLEAKVHSLKTGLIGLQSSVFYFQTIEECKSIAYIIAGCFPDRETAMLGLYEMMVNAVEHGNLGITCEEKTACICENRWQEEVRRRLAMPEYKDKRAKIEVQLSDEILSVTITDQGKGFNWEKYTTFDPERALAPNGRGVMIAKSATFDEIEYIAPGNKVICRVKRDETISNIYAT